MIVLLGASGYVGRAFQLELIRREIPYIPLSRRQIDYTDYYQLVTLLRGHKPAFLINAAGYVGKPNVDACELQKYECWKANITFPLTVSFACGDAGIPWGHVSSGCIYDWKNTSNSAFRPYYSFSELDKPNFCFNSLSYSFYGGTKALCEEMLTVSKSDCYLWRLRIPFNNIDGPRNYISKLMRYELVYQAYNSLSHLNDYAKACLDLWEIRAARGTYNMTNPGFVRTSEVVSLIQKYLNPPRQFKYWQNDQEYYKYGAKTPRSNCVLDTEKLHSVGVRMRPVIEALEDSLQRWVWEAKANGV